MIEAMSSSRRFLLLLLAACVTCVFLVQVTLDGWNFRTSFSYGLHAESKNLQELEVKEVAQLTKVEIKSESTTSTTPKLKLTTPSKPFSTKAPYSNSFHYKNISRHSIGTGQVRRVPLGKNSSKYLKEKPLVNRRDRIQEILKQSSVIRGRSTVDPMRSLKSIPVVNPNNVTKIILLTYFRSGSSFFGDLLQQNWKTFYHFEPLHYMTYNSRISDNKTQEAFELFNGVFNCNFTELKDYIKWVKQPHCQFLFAHNLFLRVTCHSNPKICFNPTFVNAVCSRAPVHVMKLTRLHMRHLKSYIEENPHMNIKVVYLTRDPRGIVSSRWSLEWCNGTTECSDPNFLCHEMSEDLKIFDELQKENPSNFIKVRYEDITLNPESESRNLFKFLKLPFSTTVQRFLKTHTVGRRTDDNNPYSTRRNTTSMAFSWRERFTYKQVVDVQRSCEGVLKDLNYSLITTPQQLPFPNGKVKVTSNSSQSRITKSNKNPLFLKSQILNKTASIPIDTNINLVTNNSSIQIWNNTNIEIHKTLSNDSSKINTRTDYILVKQTVKR